MIIREIYEYINSIAPYNTQLGFDNSGLNVGGMNDTVHKIGVCLDLDEQAVGFAKNNGIDLIISHHPVIWGGLKNIGSDGIVYMLIRHGIAALSAHTNLDTASGGVCETLCDKLGFHSLENAYLDEFPDTPIARMGVIGNDMTADDFAAFLKETLSAPDVRYHSCGKAVHKIGVFNGAGADLIPFAAAHGADSVVTGDVKHHEWLDVARLGINLFDAGHFCTENMIVSKLCGLINDKFGDIAQIIPQTSPYKSI